ncbi:hypothetical protein HYH02_006720 [Chlamydomonas schloesseri]|uniref:U-box domain-containing protein n=1 Tax=Chlamydomonas schloesseri TaxID=2026947 RepID=A0A835WIM5_9CHLO|nr:hypothetical protein HYH02_006720 [Chlamydomonas schloesseri]|eukprot:KAG2448135.1 hypothetical protein HYH02_006720 [Chlamydomonas schloesseri]
MGELNAIVTKLAGCSAMKKFLKAGDYKERLKSLAVMLSHNLQAFQTVLAVQQHVKLKDGFAEMQKELVNVKLEALDAMYTSMCALKAMVEQQNTALQRLRQESTDRDERLQQQLRQRDEQLQETIRKAVVEGLQGLGVAATPVSLHSEGVASDLRDQEYEYRQHKMAAEADFMVQLAQALTLAEVSSAAAPAAAAGSGGGGAGGPPSLRMEPPERFLCGILKEVMCDPVQLVSADGQAYERAAIQQWLACKDTNPMTNEVLKTRELVPNKCLQAEIEAWHRERGLPPPAAPMQTKVLTRVDSHRPARRTPPSTPARAAKAGGQEADLLRLAETGLAPKVVQLLHQGVNPNIYDKDGWTPLMCAARHGHVEVVAALLDAEANPNTRSQQDGCTAMLLAARHGHSRVVSLLLQGGAEPGIAASDGWTPLGCAAAHGNVEVARQLLAERADSDFVEAATQDGWTPLVLAARKGHANVVDLLLKHGAQIDAGAEKGFYPLTCAVAGGHVDAARTLLEHGAKWSEQDKVGMAMEVFVNKSTVEMQQLFREYGRSTY